MIKRRCVNLVFGDAFEEFCHAEDSDTISPKIITVLTLYRPIVLELI